MGFIISISCGNNGMTLMGRKMSINSKLYRCYSTLLYERSILIEEEFEKVSTLVEE